MGTVTKNKLINGQIQSVAFKHKKTPLNKGAFLQLQIPEKNELVSYLYTFQIGLRILIYYSKIINWSITY